MTNTFLLFFIAISTFLNDVHLHSRITKLDKKLDELKEHN